MSDEMSNSSKWILIVVTMVVAVVVNVILWDPVTDDKLNNQTIIEDKNKILLYDGYKISTIFYDGHDYIMCSHLNNNGVKPVSMIHSENCKTCLELKR